MVSNEFVNDPTKEINDVLILSAFGVLNPRLKHAFFYSTLHKELMINFFLVGSIEGYDGINR